MKLRAMIVAGWLLMGSGQSQQKPEVKGPVSLRATPPAGRKIAAFPRLVAGGEVTAPVADKVNASLGQLDASVVKAVARCPKQTKEASFALWDPFWERSVEVTMRGPRFLSMFATDSDYCGGPQGEVPPPVALVYDLTTGTPINWLKYLPAEAKSTLSASDDGARLGAIVWPALSRRARNQSDAKCKDSYAAEIEVDFVLWLDARGGQVVAQPLGIDRNGSDCTVSIVLSVSEARKMGVHGDVLDALEAANKLQ